MTAVHQVLPVLAPHDAVGNHTLQLRDALREAGFESEVFAEMRLGHHRDTGRALDELPASGTDLVIYQSSTGSTAVDWLLRRSDPLAVNYHNITPASFFEAWDDLAAASMRRARVQLGALARRSRLALADSPFNAAELTDLGYSPVVVAPLLLDMEGRLAAPDPVVADHLARTRAGHQWLYVGRLVPNKAQHDIIAAFAAYRLAYDPHARLTLIGSEAAPAYSDALYGLVDDLDLHGAVTFTGPVADGELAAYFAAADVYVSLSRHEGFGVPLLEAMRHDVPVVALAAAAVPDTVGTAAVLVDDSTPELVAATVRQLLADEPFRRQLVVEGRARVAAHSLAAGRAQWVDLIRRHLGLAVA